MADLFEMTGIREMQERLAALPMLVVQIAGIALQQEADAVLEKSQALVPVDTGELRASGTTDPVVIDGMTVSTGVRYGGPGTGTRVPSTYAIKVHEDTTLHHPRGGQSHFLSQPLFEETDGMLARLADAILIAL